MTDIPQRVKPFWNAFQATLGLDIDGRFYESFYFADSEASADALAALVLAGTKRAAACLVWGLQAEKKSNQARRLERADPLGR